MRIVLDTCAVIDLTTDPDALDEAIVDIFDDGENRLYISFETARELIVQFNNKKLLHKRWDSSEKMLDDILNDYGVELLPLRESVAFTYSRLRLNTAQDHKDPSDHVIIAHAIAERLTLISSDTRFPFYRNQGLNSLNIKTNNNSHFNINLT